MPKRKSYLLRLDPAVYEALRKWADDEFRSLNGHIEYLLRYMLKKNGRFPKNADEGGGDGATAD